MQDKILNKNFFLFDMDGVVLDSMHYHALSWIEVGLKYGLKFSKEEIFLYEGAFEKEIVKDLFEKKGVPFSEEFFRKLIEDYKRIFKIKYAWRINPFPEIPRILHFLKSCGKRLAIVTSSSKEFIHEVLKNGIKDFFDVIITAEDVKRRKPYPDPYLAGLEKLDASPESALVIENSPAGVRAAKLAGLPCIAISTTLPATFLKEADFIVSHHGELLKIFLEF